MTLTPALDAFSIFPMIASSRRSRSEPARSMMYSESMRMASKVIPALSQFFRMSMYQCSFVNANKTKHIPRSKCQAQGQLNYAGIGCGCDDAISGRRHGGSGQSKVYPIQRIEELGTDLQPHVFSDPHNLEERY